MIQVIPAHMENGSVVPDLELPADVDVRTVSIVVEVVEREGVAPSQPSSSRLFGILRGRKVTRDDYREHLEQKYR